MTKPATPKPEEDFAVVLERGVRDILKNGEATAAEKLGAINTGAKLLMIRHRIGEPEPNFFNK